MDFTIPGHQGTARSGPARRRGGRLTCRPEHPRAIAPGTGLPTTPRTPRRSAAPYPAAQPPRPRRALRFAGAAAARGLGRLPDPRFRPGARLRDGSARGRPAGLLAVRPDGRRIHRVLRRSALPRRRRQRARLAVAESIGRPDQAPPRHAVTVRVRQAHRTLTHGTQVHGVRDEPGGHLLGQRGCSGPRAHQPGPFGRGPGPADDHHGPEFQCVSAQLEDGRRLRAIPPVPRRARSRRPRNRRRCPLDRGRGEHRRRRPGREHHRGHGPDGGRPHPGHAQRSRPTTVTAGTFSAVPSPTSASPSSVTPPAPSGSPRTSRTNCAPTPRVTPRLVTPGYLPPRRLRYLFPRRLRYLLPQGVSGRYPYVSPASVITHSSSQARRQPPRCDIDAVITVTM